MVFRGQKTVRLQTQNSGDVAGQQKSLHRAGGVVQQGAQGRGHQFVQGKHAEVFDLAPAGRKQGGRHRGRGGFKADAQKNHRVVGIGRGQAQGVQGRIDDLHARALGLGMLEAAPAGSRHAQQVAEGGHNDPLPSGQVQKCRHFRIVRHANRTARSGKVGDRGGQQGAQTALENGYRMRAADLHETHGAPVQGAFQALQEAMAESGILKGCVQLHGSSRSDG